MDLWTPEQINALLQTPGHSARVYLVGAGGAGMSALGHLLLDLGHTVSGSDLALNDEILRLRARGAWIHVGHAAEQITAAQPALVVYSSAIRANNPELAAAQHRQFPIVRRAALLAALMNRHRGICVAGMHGKTTTTSLLAFALEHLQAQPSYAIGATVPQLAQPARMNRTRFRTDTAGSSKESRAGDPPLNCLAPLAEQPDWFAVEADESDGTLREFRPEHAIVLNVDEEHLDYYANLDAVCREFLAFAEQTRDHLVFCADDPRLAKLFGQHPRAIAYGFHPLAAYRIASVRPAAGRETSPAQSRGSTFEIWRGGERWGEFAIQLLGGKNVSNAAAVIALLHQIGYEPRAIAAALAPFRGAARRLQELFCDGRFWVFDDYGHHPSEITATLDALKTLGRRRLLVAFQPHRFTRTQMLLQQFSTCFRDADRLWVTEIYAANEAEIPGVNGRLLADAVRSRGQEAEYVPSLDALGASIREAMEPGDLVLFLGAGDITQAAHKLAAQLREEPASSIDALFTELAGKLLPETVLRRNEPLAKRTTLRVGGRADFYVEPASEGELAEVLRLCAARRLPFVMLGRGSNLLIRDGGIRGVVICLASAHFCRVEILGERLHCGAGAKLKMVAVQARRRGLTGLEFLEGIPGSVGGALRMNAGAMGAWMFEVVETIRFMDFHGRIHERQASEVNVEYRGCPLFKNHIALGAVLKGQCAPREAIEQKMNAYSQKRWDSQPAALSAGCIFKNPRSITAGKLIDELGLKGTRVGGAVVSEVHGNFIVNDGNATAEEVLRLIEIVRQRAKTARGIELETEVEIIGE